MSSDSESDHEVYIVKELDELLYDFMSEIKLYGFRLAKTKTDKFVCEIPSINKFIEMCIDTDSDNFALSDASYEIRFCDKYIILTYEINYITDRFTPIHHYILVNDCGNLCDYNIHKKL